MMLEVEIGIEKKRRGFNEELDALGSFQNDEKVGSI